MTRVPVKVEGDHLERLVRPSLRRALSELIWNSVDADASAIEISITENDLGGVDQVEISDDGLGMTHESAVHDFGLLGGSWKRSAQFTRTKKRLLHGKEGQGRWRAFGLGDRVRWFSVAEIDGSRKLTEITGLRNVLSEFDVVDAGDTDKPRGTTAIIDNLHASEVNRLLDGSLSDELAAEFALYLEEYPDVILSLGGTPISPTELQADRTDYEVPSDSYGNATLTVIEWKRPFDRALYLCDPNGIALAHIPPGIQAPGFDFTAYLRWEGFRAHESILMLADLGAPEITPIIEDAKEVLRAHFKERASLVRRAVITEWKAQDVYPFEGDAATPVEQVKRDLFEVVALSASDAINNAEVESRKLSLGLLKVAIEESPSSVRRVLGEVLHLPKDKLDELTLLLDRTSLAAIISSAKIVADRLDFLHSLEVLLFEPENKAALLERRQLHRIVAEETWIFGEEFALAVDDQSLSQVLHKHRELLGRDDVAADVDEKVLDLDGHKAIVDLMLARAIPQSKNQREHLVVELKRPSVKVGDEELTQIRKYAFAVAADERFSKTETQWEFWVVSNELTPYAELEANQTDRPRGLVHDQNGVRIWVKTWAEIIEECAHRLKFVQERLDYSSTRDHAIAYLRETHDRYLPDPLQAEAASPDVGPTPPDTAPETPGSI